METPIYRKHAAVAWRSLAKAAFISGTAFTQTPAAVPGSLASGTTSDESGRGICTGPGVFAFLRSFG